MLQALLTTMMLAIDEEQTQAQMKEAGIETPPTLNDFLGQLDLMINEVAQAADEAMVGAKAQSVNPFKDIGVTTFARVVAVKNSNSVAVSRTK